MSYRIRNLLNNHIVRILIFLSLCFLVQPAIYSQQQQKRPRIGLALSGGGALGMAHIGTLKVMEEAGLRPDYITGVSMGSIVGGLYSLGYSADSLEKLFRSADWKLILSNNLPENKVIFTEKSYFNNSIMSLPVTSRKVQLPTGLITGQWVENMLSYYAWPAADINDFSKFPIPFMCLGTDIVSFKKVDLKKGYLPDAIRASMAVPSIFTPMRIDTAIIIDGGFVRNIAVSELRTMGADIIIGSYTGFQRINEEQLQSITGVMRQLSFFNSFLDYLDEKKKVDILIEPQVKDLPVYNFANSDSIIQRGYKAALPFKEEFRRIADSLNRIAPQDTLRNILNKRTYVFDRIEVTGNKFIPDDQILGVMDINPHERIDKEMLSKGIELLYGRAWFEKVKYRIIPKEDSLILNIDCIEKPKTVLYGSVHYDNSIRAGIILGLTAKNPVFGRSMFSINTFIGQYYRYTSSYTQFVDRNQLFGLSADFNGDYTLLPMMTLRNQAGQVNRRFFSSGLSLNERMGLNHMMSLSADYETLALTPDYIAADQLRRVTYNYLTLSFKNELNSLDTKYFPKKGTLFQIQLNSTKLLSGVIRTISSRQVFREGSPGDFGFRTCYSLTSDIRQYITARERLTFVLGGDLLLTQTADTTVSPIDYYYLGGQDYTIGKSIPMTGFHSNEIPIEKLARFALDADYSLSDRIHLGVMTNIAIAHEVGLDKKWSLLGGIGVQAGYMSFVGPVRIGLVQGFSSGERYFKSVKGFISLGYNF